MAFTNSPDFEDDFRKVGPDATADFAPLGAPSEPLAHASSENVEVAGAADSEEDDDLEDDEDLDDDEEDDDLEDVDDEDEEDDLDTDDEDDEDDLEDEDADEDDDEDDEEEDDLEEDPDAVKARLGTAEKRVRAS